MVTRETAHPLEALDWVRRGDPFDLAILDVMMPEMDGVALAAAIRQLHDARALPLVFFSSLGRQETGASGLEIAAYLMKPLTPSSLFNTLVGIFEQEIVPIETAVPTTPAPDVPLGQQLPLRILLAEDNAVNQKLAVRLLQRLGYDPAVVANGREALEAAEAGGYDVILMDVQMPEMDGLEATRQICRRMGRDQRPRIVAMTANAMQGDREACLEAGMDDYLSKPIRVAELVGALERGAASMTRRGTA
jgi:CheY-like chemotaxis protein